MAPRKSKKKKQETHQKNSKSMTLSEDDKRAIKMHFAPDKEPLEFDGKPSPTDIAVIAAALSVNRQGEIDRAILEEATKLWEQSALALAVNERQKKQREVILEKLFKNNEAPIAKDVFLQRLLPRESVEKRKIYLEEALARITTTFLDRFSHGGAGWPTEEHSKLLKNDPDEAGECMKNSYLEELENGVDLKLACQIAPFVLSWRDYVSSPQVRGSLSRSPLAKK